MEHERSIEAGSPSPELVGANTMNIKTLIIGIIIGLAMGIALHYLAGFVWQLRFDHCWDTYPAASQVTEYVDCMAPIRWVR